MVKFVLIFVFFFKNPIPSPSLLTNQEEERFAREAAARAEAERRAEEERQKAEVDRLAREAKEKQRKEQEVCVCLICCVFVFVVCLPLHNPQIISHPRSSVLFTDHFRFFFFFFSNRRWLVARPRSRRLASARLKSVCAPSASRHLNALHLAVRLAWVVLRPRLLPRRALLRTFFAFLSLFLPFCLMDIAVVN